MSDPNSVKFCTYNVKGIHHPIKRKKLLSFLKKDKVQIAFLQETHLIDKEHIKLKRDWVGQVYYSSFSSNSRGVAILIHKAIPFVLSSCKQDPEGRYILVHGTIYGMHITMMNIYAPNPPPPSFWTKVATELEEFRCPITLLGGDCNCCQDDSKDRSRTDRYRNKSSDTSLAKMLDDINLIDIWRVLNPTARDFTFYSNPHKFYSRIDHFFIPPHITGQATSCNIGSIHISDHAPVYLEIAMRCDIEGPRRWRFPSYLLSDKDFKKKMKEEMGLFFDKNDNGDTNPEFLWEAAKAYVRGIAISYMAWRKKVLLLKQRELEAELKAAEFAHKSSPTRTNLIKVQTVRAALNSVLNEKASRSLFYQRQRLYEYGNKPSKYLARLLNQRQNHNTIGGIRDTRGKKHFDKKDINSVFVSFYKTLYTSDNNCTKEELDKLFSKIHLPTLTEEQQRYLGKPIQEAEILQAISLMRSGKSPGPDGLPVEWFKAYKDKLTPYLAKTFNYSFNIAHHLPETMSLANICLILKKDKDPEDPASYRPISLIKVDAKILAKILTLRLEPLMQTLVRPDQTGFIKGRSSSNNIRRLLNIIQMASNEEIQGLIVSLDSLKAFDRIEWPYLFYTMEKFKLGTGYIDWVKLLYRSHKATVTTNSCCSSPFPLGRGTPQGCPLSPLMFALAIEPLAELIRSTPAIKGFLINGKTHKISLYADDVLLYLVDIDTTIPSLLDCLQQFGHISGFKVNLTKTEAMPVGALAGSSPPSGFPFHWSPKEITYLGIKIGPSLRKLIKLNLTPVTMRIREDLHRWGTLPVSWLGRISVLKMNILPRLLYPLQMLPNTIPNSFFSNLNKLFTQFLWQGKRVRMKIGRLQRNKNNGGLGVPNICFYYWASQMRYIYEWVNPDVTNTWIDIESRNCGVLKLKDCPFVNHKKAKQEVHDNFIVLNTLNTWSKIKVHFKLKNNFSLLAPIWRNPDFLPSCQDPVFKVWQEKGLDQLAKLFTGGTMESFESLKSKYSLQQSHFFRFLQIRHYVIRNMQTSSSSFLENLLVQPLPKKFISCMYKAFDVNSNYSTDHIRRQWQIDLECQIGEDTWTTIMKNTLTILSCNNDRERQFKILHRLHYTPLMRGRLGLSSSNCNKCDREIGTYAHMFWKCSKIQMFWNEVKKELDTLIGHDLDLSPLQCILAAKVSSARNNHNAKLIGILLYMARKTILKFWIHKDTPTLDDWYKEVMSIIPLEKLTYSLHDNLEGFTRVWQPVFDAVDPSGLSFNIPH